MKLGNRKIKLGDNGVRALAFFALFIVFGLINPTVWSAVNIAALLNNSAFIGIMALGLMAVMITGNLDLSLVSIGLTSAYTTIMLYQALGWESGGVYLMFLISGGIGILCGLINGFFVYKFKIPGIIVSLGMAQIYNSLMLVLLGVTYIPVLPEGMRQLSRIFVFQTETELGTAAISFSTVLYAVAIIFVWFILNKTMVGRGIYALGGDKEAAMRAGFNTPKVYSYAYGIMGLMAGIAGMMYYANNTLFQSDWILVEQSNATAAAIFGGVIMKNGKGTVGGVVMGVMLIGLITNNLYLIGIPSYAQKVVVGLIILISVAMTSLNQLREMRLAK